MTRNPIADMHNMENRTVGEVLSMMLTMIVMMTAAKVHTLKAFMYL